MPVEFRIFIKHNCHLCEDMLEMLYEYQHDPKYNKKFRIELIDIERISEQEYLSVKDKIPLMEVRNNGNWQEICHYYFDLHTFLDCLAKN